MFQRIHLVVSVYFFTGFSQARNGLAQFAKCSISSVQSRRAQHDSCDAVVLLQIPKREKQVVQGRSLRRLASQLSKIRQTIVRDAIGHGALKVHHHPTPVLNRRCAVVAHAGKPYQQANAQQKGHKQSGDNAQKGGKKCFHIP